MMVNIVCICMTKWLNCQIMCIFGLNLILDINHFAMHLL